VVRKRTLLLTVAGLLCAAAVYAIGVLAVGRFGSTQARIVGTTALLAAFSLLAFPAVVLTEQRRAPRLALATATVAGAGAVLAITALWWPGSVTGRAALTGAVAAAAVTQPPWRAQLVGAVEVPGLTCSSCTMGSGGGRNKFGSPL